MAEARICDRCGAVFKGEDAFVNARYTVFDSFYDDNALRNMYCGKNIGACVDLCKSCSDSLQQWFDEKDGNPF